MRAFLLCIVFVSAVSAQTCAVATSTLGPCILETLGQSCASGAGICTPSATGLDCCPTANVVGSTTTVTTTTVTTTSTCYDLTNPITGVSDCPSRAYLCNNALYYSLMTIQCPRTCGRCSSSSSTTCYDRLNPLTGISDCPYRTSYCTRTYYRTLMRQQCPKTCGYCTTSATTYTSTTCADLVNPSTGVSDCSSRAYLCTNAIYSTLMRTQCPVTCGYC